MIHVVANVSLKDGTREAYLAEFGKIVPAVHAEHGCLAYGITVDARTDIDAQMPYRTDTVTVVEQWESVDALKAHLTAPHMVEFFAKTGEMATGLTLQILEPA